jgi:hypothetical protein
VNALANERVAEYVRDNLVATYLKVGTFQIIGGQKVGGNVASYFCLPDGSVLHAVPGKVDGAKLLSEARWATEVRKSALTRSTNLVTGALDEKKFRSLVQQAHIERFVAEVNPHMLRLKGTRRAGDINSVLKLPALPRNVSQQAQAHWLLARAPLEQLDRIYPIVWQEVLGEQLSGLPVVER